MMFEILKEENYYGHRKRLFWIQTKIPKNAECIDVGCGTGSLVTIPLNILGCNVFGIDIDENSIIAAKLLAQEAGVSTDKFICGDIKNVKQKYDVVIASEVLEHIDDKTIKEFMKYLCKMVKSQGKLIITVPNGKGSYERGQRNWAKYWGRIYDRCTSTLIWKKMVKTKQEENLDRKMSLNQTPHVQFFSYSDIIELVGDGFKLVDFTGSAMFSGVIINAVFPKRKLKQFICKINNFLGKSFPKKSSGYYFEFIKI